MASFNKCDYLLENLETACAAFEVPVAAFGENNDLLLELRTVFDWMAEEKGATRIPSRQFKARLPEIHKKFPLLAMNFARMDRNGDCWLDWNEFVTFCLKDERLHRTMKRATSIHVYSVDHKGARMYKDTMDPVHACENSTVPPLLPWESHHCVEWRIEGLEYNDRGLPVLFGGNPINPGACITSPPFLAAGVSGCLKFWPVSYWNEARRRKKSAVPGGEEDRSTGGLCPLPAVNSWCCVGVSLPPGEHLQLRFYVGDQSSEIRECYWSKGIHAAQLWAPGGKSPLEEAGMRNSSRLVVGIEIHRNKGIVHGKPKMIKLLDKARLNTRPAMKPPLGVALPNNSVLLSRSSSMPQVNVVGPSSLHKSFSSFGSRSGLLPAL